jgi:hypothetical protein
LEPQFPRVPDIDRSGGLQTASDAQKKIPTRSVLFLGPELHDSSCDTLRGQE